jgi:hypothetical protein
MALSFADNIRPLFRWPRGERLGRRKTEAVGRWSLNFVLLPNRPRTAHNQTVPIGEPS